jgi:formylglycine-generating enzyme required for sulfatase activity
MAARIVGNLRFDRIVMEDFEAGSRRPPLEECLRKVREDAELLIVIVARRYGWVPSDDWPKLPASQQGKSITWIECLEAQQKGIPIIPLILNEATPWPEQLVEHTRAGELETFKRWLELQFIAKRFTSIESFTDELTRALAATFFEDTADDPARYLSWVMKQTERTIKPPWVSGSWDGLYVSLPTVGPGRRRAESVQSFPRLAIVGDAGSGKSTVLAKYARDLAQNAGSGRFPLLIHCGEFWTHVFSYLQRHEAGAPSLMKSPKWVSHFLAAASAQRECGLSSGFFEALLRRGDCALLLDGFDVSDHRKLAGLLDEVAAAYPQCQIVLTSRPAAVIDPPELQQFTYVRMAPLDNKTIRTLLLRWSSLSMDLPDQAQQHAKVVFDAIMRSRAIRALARVPLLLRILATQYKDASAFPATRAQLYEAMTTQLLATQGEVLDRPITYEPLDLLQELAWCMHQTAPTARPVVTKRWAAEQVQDIIGKSATLAVKELDWLAQHKGVLAVEEGQLRFWHPTFQEFLAARRLAYASRATRMAALASAGERLPSDAWRPALQFLCELLREEPDELKLLYDYLLTSAERTTSDESRAQYTATIISLQRETSDVPESLRGRLTVQLTSFHDRFRTGRLEGIDLSTRIELARAIGSAWPNTEMEWVQIPAGEFRMGAQSTDASQPGYDPAALSGEGPVHQVRLQSYWLGKFPVTVAQYQRFVETGGYTRDDLWTQGGSGMWSSPLRWEEQVDNPMHPVTGISWYEAQAFCSWAECRLPSEAEWERAAAGPEGRRFPWGSAAPTPSCANYDRRFDGVVPVGLFVEYPSAEGVHDLAGNVWEWVGDTYGPYRSRPELRAKSHEPIEDSRKVLRGGCFLNDWRFLRSSERIYAVPTLRYTNFGSIGFRCGRNA